MDVVSILLANIHIGFISIDFSLKKSLSKAIGVQICATLFVMVCGCTKDSTPKDPVDTLPPITQTGEDTFACLINGKPFFSSSERFASYVFNTLSIGGSRRDDLGLRSILLSALEIEGGVKEGIFPLTTRKNGGYSSQYFIDGGLTLDARTQDANPGLLTITRFDLEEFIVSGTFEFTAISEQGEEYHITHGRFDLKF